MDVPYISEGSEDESFDLENDNESVNSDEKDMQNLLQPNEEDDRKSRY